MSSLHHTEGWYLMKSEVAHAPSVDLLSTKGERTFAIWCLCHISRQGPVKSRNQVHVCSKSVLHQTLVCHCRA